MAEETDSSATDAPDDVAATVPARSRRDARAAAVPPTTSPPAKQQRALARTAPPSTPRATKKKSKPLRSLVILAMVGGLIATVALPAYGAFRPAAQAQTLQQVAADNAQSLVVASDVTGTELARDSYSATTAEEIAKKKAEEAAAQRARELAAAAAASASSSSSSSSSSSRLSGMNLNMVAPGSGAVRWPLTSYTLGQRVGARGGAHQGTDYLAPAMTPIFAVASGVVAVSQESYGGYGAAVAIDSVINGQRVGSIYAHMTYGTRQVSAGQTVEAGQLIGFVGSTGRSTANHLHLEIRINGGVVDSHAWLEANAG